MIPDDPSDPTDPHPSKTPQPEVSRRFLVKEIALQSGTSAATVDRVLNRRGGVRDRTVARVLNALRELEHQDAWTAARGQILVVDFLVEAPRIFLNAIKSAMEEELALSSLGAFRVRQDMRTTYSASDLARALHTLARRGSDGVIVMGPDSPPVRDGIASLVQAGIPVLTMATDIPGSARDAYIGMDNRRAGLTAAWFMHKVLRDDAAGVLVTMRNPKFRGEADRCAGFRIGLRRHFRQADMVVLVESPTRRDIGEQVARALRQHPGIGGVYSIGGSNVLISQAMRDVGYRPRAFIAHDLDVENANLMRAGDLDVLIHHDFREDIRNALRALIALRSKGRIAVPDTLSSLRVVLPPMLP
jgi:LacI family transcriptional regulator